MYLRLLGNLEQQSTIWSVDLTLSVSLGVGKSIGGESGENCAVFGRKSSSAKSGENRRAHHTDRYQLCRSALYTGFTQLMAVQCTVEQLLLRQRTLGCLLFCVPSLSF